MKLKNLEIKNYRRFIDTKINLDDKEITILAGANNSGKTSLVYLLESIFSGQNKISLSDNSIKNKKIYYKGLLNKIQSKITEDPSVNMRSVIEEYIVNNLSDGLIQTNFTISYTEDEDISLFANFLMDLDEEIQEFYFSFRQEVNKSKLSNLDPILFENLQDICSSEPINYGAFSSVLDNILELVIVINYYYSDREFLLLNSMNQVDFQNLFNFKLIYANRELDDGMSKNRKITSAIIDNTSPLENGQHWEDVYENTYDNINNNLLNSDITSKISYMTQDSLKRVLDDLNDVSEHEIVSIKAYLEFTKEKLLSLIKSSLIANYVYDSDDNISLGEETQGLGISNLIYLSLQVLNYKKTVSPEKINLFIIEEPEVHLHVQMEKILIDFINSSLTDNETHDIVQGVITTHSSELIGNVNLNTIRVIRPLEFLENKIFDMSEFLASKDSFFKNFINTFFKLNFTNLIFSDKAILYEGDTEKLYIESIITRDTFNDSYKSLSKQYISYCQVGGDHAYNYFELLEFLQIKTCVFTDLDYSVGTSDVDSLLIDKSSNSTINKIVKNLDASTTDDEDNPKIQEIYNWQNDLDRTSSNSNIRVYTQTDEDGYARTLEDAILFKIISDSEITSVFKNIEKANWKDFVQSSNLLIPLPQNNTGSSIRDRAKNIKKTNFIYSLIMSDSLKDSIPDYIERGLEWLNND